MLLYENENQLKKLEYSVEGVRELNTLGIIATCVGNDSYDFLSRFFAPSVGLYEDPVTGSAHCTLIPFWSERLGKKTNEIISNFCSRWKTFLRGLRRKSSYWRNLCSLFGWMD